MKKLLFSLTMAGASALQAGVIGYSYSGTITDFHGPFEPKFGGASLGDTVTGSFSYDTTAVVTGNSSLANFSLLSLSIHGKAFSYSLPSPGVEIDAKTGYYWNAGGQSADHSFFIGLNLDDTISPYVQTDALLLPPPDLSQIDTHYGTLLFYHSPQSSITYFNFEIDRLTPQGSGVPDSGATAGLLAFSVGLLMFRQYNVGQKRRAASSAF